MLERIPSPSITAAAVSSQELSIARTRIEVRSGRRFDREEDGVVAAAHEEEHVPRLVGGLDLFAVVADVLDRLAVHLEDDVAAPQAGVLRRAAGLDGGHDHAL